MLSSLASVLFLGIVLPTPIRPLPRPLPGIEALSVTPPAKFLRPLVVPELSASGVLLLDAASSQEIYSKSPDVRRPIASLTKIMTALLVLERHSTSTIVTIPPIAENIRGSTVGLIPGQHISVGNLTKALLLPSANDAAYALATFDAKGVGAFVRTMNERAVAMGLENTHFANPAGLDHPEQYSTPRDLGWLALAALRNPTFASIVQTRSARVSTSEGKEYSLRNTNELLHYNEDVYGVKTGTTDAAGECLIVLFREKDRPYLLVLLGSKDRYTDSLHILQSVHTAS